MQKSSFSFLDNGSVWGTAMGSRWWYVPSWLRPWEIRGLCGYNIQAKPGFAGSSEQVRSSNPKRILKRKNSINCLQNLPENLSSFETWNFLQHRIGHLYSKLRFRLDFNVMGTRRIHVSGVEKSSRMPATGRSVIHDSVSFVLSLAFRRGLLAFGWWKRPRHVLLDPGIQVLFSYSFSVLHFWSFRFFSSKFDLYSKSDQLPDIEELKPYYQSLIDKYVPGTVKF